MKLKNNLIFNENNSNNKSQHPEQLHHRMHHGQSVKRPSPTTNEKSSFLSSKTRQIFGWKKFIISALRCFSVVKKTRSNQLLKAAPITPIILMNYEAVGTGPGKKIKA